MSSLSRQTTTSTLPEYSGPPSSHDPMPPMSRQPTLPSISPFSSRPPPSRYAPQYSKMSYASSASSKETYAPSGRFHDRNPMPPPHVGSQAGQPPLPPLSRSFTGTTLSSQPSTRSGTSSMMRTPLNRTPGSQASSRSRFPTRPYPPPSRGLSNMSSGPPPSMRQNTQTSEQSYRVGNVPSGSGPRTVQVQSADAWMPQSAQIYTAASEASAEYTPYSAPPTTGGRFVPYSPQDTEPPLPSIPRASTANGARKFSAPTYRSSSIYSEAPANIPAPLRYGTAPPGPNAMGSAPPFGASHMNDRGPGRMPRQQVPGPNSGEWF